MKNVICWTYLLSCVACFVGVCALNITGCRPNGTAGHLCHEKGGIVDCFLLCTSPRSDAVTGSQAKKFCTSSTVKIAAAKYDEELKPIFSELLRNFGGNRKEIRAWVLPPDTKGELKCHLIIYIHNKTFETFENRSHRCKSSIAYQYFCKFSSRLACGANVKTRKYDVASSAAKDACSSQNVTKCPLATGEFPFKVIVGLASALTVCFILLAVFAGIGMRYIMINSKNLKSATSKRQRRVPLEYIDMSGSGSRQGQPNRNEPNESADNIPIVTPFAKIGRQGEQENRSDAVAAPSGPGTAYGDHHYAEIGLTDTHAEDNYYSNKIVSDIIRNTSSSSHGGLVPYQGVPVHGQVDGHVYDHPASNLESQSVGTEGPQAGRTSLIMVENQMFQGDY